MIHLDFSLSLIVSGIIFNNQEFMELFAYYEQELFERTEDEKIYYINQKYSEYECRYLIKIFDKYKKAKPIKVKVYDNGNFDILIGKKKIGELYKSENGFLATYQIIKNGPTTLCQNWRTKKDFINWASKRRNYLKFQIKYDFNV